MKPNSMSGVKVPEFEFTSKDKEMLEPLYAVAEGIAKLFGNNCEVVVHCLEDLAHSVVKIVNGHVTGRDVGSPMTDYGLELLDKGRESGKNVFGQYYTKLDDGRWLRSVSILLRNTQGNPIGFLCINLDLSVPFLEFLRQFAPGEFDSHDEADEHFPSNCDELVDKMLETVMTRFGSQEEFSTRERNKAIIAELYKKGMFRIADVIDILAEKMNISRYTIYNYIREAKMKRGE